MSARTWHHEFSTELLQKTLRKVLLHSLSEISSISTWLLAFKNNLHACMACQDSVSFSPTHSYDIRSPIIDCIFLTENSNSRKSLFWPSWPLSSTTTHNPADSSPPSCCACEMLQYHLKKSKIRKASHYYINTSKIWATLYLKWNPSNSFIVIFT